MEQIPPQREERGLGQKTEDAAQPNRLREPLARVDVEEP